ncbi:type IV pilus twitching motility protein PilT [Geothrix sp. 21YS21S-2]|uniref:type IV pilus twitching motility protein PilT n=1 Tax=Geothrix sp. 21YS21S-2 TaxID=3068893 RepID=UPI0027B97EAA|nr:PilT/PilU family type 4a pilus ATPase [Geothrix sp. 21YS21S-2]
MSQPGQDLNKLVAELNQGLESPDLELRREEAGPSPELDAMLRQARSRGASDLLLVAGAPVAFRVDGRMERDPGAALEGDQIRRLLVPLLTSPQQKELERNRSVDFCFTWKGTGRFRVNVHYQRGTVAGSLRLLPLKVPTLQSLNLPPGLRRLAEGRQGLVLVTGATGSGKSSTLAALLDIVNAERQDHIVTIEDPVEYVHPSRKSIVEHIEVGPDAPDFASSIRSIVRQSPDVILVGEMRDPETIQTVLTAAETGHLVFSTLHTNDASQAVSRILDSFPMSNQPQIRQQLSLALSAIVAQQLVPSRTGAMMPALEILHATHAVRNTIRKGDDHQLYTLISTGRADGMTTMEQSLAEMAKAGRISEETALARCFRPSEIRRYLG